MKDLPARLAAHVDWVASNGSRGQHLRLSDTTLEGVDFTGANLERALFDSVNFRSCDFSRAQLPYAGFRHCALHSAKFTAAQLCGVWFESCDLAHADFRYADLRWAFCTNSALLGADFYEAKRDDIYFDCTRCHNAWRDHEGDKCLFAPGRYTPFPLEKPCR